MRDLDTVVRLVRDTEPHGLIAVDGWDGSGKSTLASALAQAVSCEYVEVDKFLERNQGGYLDRIRYPELGARLGELTELVVVEGVCLREVLARLGHAPAMSIYVKVLSSVGTWHPGRWCEFESAGEAIANHRQTLSLFARATAQPQPIDGLEEELIEYHFKWRPHEVSQLILERVESDA
ncbi:MAG: shikimate kinase [Vicinamibacterales bacterium]